MPERGRLAPGGAARHSAEMPKPIVFHDTYRGEKVAFAPADPSRVTVYCCGPTVYAAPHVGNARAAVSADLAVRLLRHEFGAESVVYVRNLTDVDDKIIKAAGGDIARVTDAATKAYHADMAALGCLPPDHEPRATAHIAEMQAMIGRLIERGHAYAAEGHVLFAVDSFERYGQLAKLDPDAMIAGARVEVAPYKRNPADFVLWKPSSAGEPGWPSPPSWGLDGAGRPGWHIECSAMIEAVLGAPVDLHMGGQDLRFPHHENEIAQSCCAGDLGDVPLSRVWLHNGMLRLGEGKMSKSKGNIVTPSELLEDWSGEVIRLALMTAHYRQPLEWSNGLLAACRAQLDRLYRAAEDAEPAGVPEAVLAPLRDDLNVPGALAALHELRDDPPALRAGAAALGLLTQSREAWFRGGATADDARFDALLEERAAARAARDFARADEIRDALAAEGILIEDGPDGARWRRA